MNRVSSVAIVVLNELPYYHGNLLKGYTKNHRLSCNVYITFPEPYNDIKMISQKVISAGLLETDVYPILSIYLFRITKI